MKMLTEEQKTEIAIEMLKKQPIDTVGHVALLKLSQLAIDTEAQNTTFTTEATFNKTRYKCKMVVTYEKI